MSLLLLFKRIGFLVAGWNTVGVSLLSYGNFYGWCEKLRKKTAVEQNAPLRKLNGIRIISWKNGNR